MNWQTFYDKVYNWIITTAPKLLIALIVLIIGFWLIRLVRRWLNNHLLRKDLTSSIRPFLVNVAVIALQVLLLLSALQIVGIQMTIFAAVLGAFGVAAGLALSGTLQNFTSGILILLLKPFRVGDNIVAQGQEGTVTAIQLFFTIVTTYDKKTIIIPNSKLSNEVIQNLSREQKRRLDMELKFGFAVDYNQVKGVIEKSLEAVSGLLKEPTHRIGISSIEADGYKVLINVWAPPHGFIDVKLLLQQQIVDDMKQAGVKLPGM